MDKPPKKCAECIDYREPPLRKTGEWPYRKGLVACKTRFVGDYPNKENNCSDYIQDILKINILVE